MWNAIHLYEKIGIADSMEYYPDLFHSRGIYWNKSIILKICNLHVTRGKTAKGATSVKYSQWPSYTDVIQSIKGNLPYNESHFFPERNVTLFYNINFIP